LEEKKIPFYLQPKMMQPVKAVIQHLPAKTWALKYGNKITL
jgi:hypothetical protein